MASLSGAGTSFTPSEGSISDAVSGVPGEVANLWNTPVVQSDDPGGFWMGLDTVFGVPSRAYREGVS